MGRASGTGVAFAAADEAFAALEAALGFLAHADAAAQPVATLADGLRALGRAEAALTAARSRFLSAFNGQAGAEADGLPTTKSWLRSQTRITNAAAGADLAWMRRLAMHPQVAAALADSTISASWARHICDLSDRLLPDVRADADAILLAAALGGADLGDLTGLAEEMLRRTARPDPDVPPGGDEDGFSDRRVWLDLHYRGAGKLNGDLTPRCAAALMAALDSLAKRAGPEDLRSKGQRYHDALEEMCRRLIAAGGLPDRAGQPTQIQLHMTLDELMRLHGTAGGAAGADDAGSDDAGPGRGGPDPAAGWLPGPAAGPGAPCDATIVPVVSGRVDPDVLDQLAARLLSRGSAGQTTRPTSGTPDARQTARDLVLADAVRLLSGPGGLAAALRAGMSFPSAAAASLPLDIGRATDTIPAHLRRAVIVRDRNCRFPGCQQPAAACDIHHVVWRTRRGRTQLINLVLLCRFHHLIAIHEWGWTITLHPDATVTAVSPDGRRTLHGHSPPGAAAA
jgi:hypothetical protein